MYMGKIRATRRKMSSQQTWKKCHQTLMASGLVAGHVSGDNIEGMPGRSCRSC